MRQCHTRCADAGSATVAAVRLTEFWQRMEDHLGPTYAASWARDTVLAELGGRTVDQALAQGEDTLAVWRAVWTHLQLPPSAR